MNIHEYQAKELLAKYGVPVPAGYAALTVDEAVAAAEKLPGPLWVVKAQIHAGGRGKGDLFVAVTVVTPEGERLPRALSVPVLARDPAVARTSRVEVGPGETFTLDDAVLAGLVPGTAEATLSIGPLARLDAAGLLAALDRSAWGGTRWWRGSWRSSRRRTRCANGCGGCGRWR